MDPPLPAPQRGGWRGRTCSLHLPVSESGTEGRLPRRRARAWNPRRTEAVGAACEGRVATLFVPAGVERWGKVDGGGRKVHVHKELQAGDEDLLDLATVQTFLQGGAVHVIPPERMPQGAEIGALLRY